MNETGNGPDVRALDVRTTGGCLCGAVRYEVRGPLRQVVNCHCGQCRRTHGAFGSYTKAKKDHVVMVEKRGLNWYRSSPRARRGFCTLCGASLFWSSDSSDTMGISAGTLDPPSGLKTVGHIFVDDKADFYDLTDGLPAHAGPSDGAFDDGFS